MVAKNIVVDYNINSINSLASERCRYNLEISNFAAHIKDK